MTEPTVPFLSTEMESAGLNVTYTASCNDCHTAKFGLQLPAHDNHVEGLSTLRYFLVLTGPSRNGEEVAAAAERHHRDTGHCVRFAREEERVIGDRALPSGVPELVFDAPEKTRPARWWRRNV